jgi:hypothetical protein
MQTMVDEHPRSGLRRALLADAQRSLALASTSGEVISVVRDDNGDEEEAAAYLGISVDLVVAATTYTTTTRLRSTSGSS